MIADFVPFVIHIGVLTILAVAMIALSHLLSPKRVPTSQEWEKAYECGLVSQGLAYDRYPVKYYLVAILFVLFDLEAVFLFPWAVSLNAFKDAGLGFLWFTEMLIFIVVLFVGYVYIVSKGALLWKEE